MRPIARPKVSLARGALALSAALGLLALSGCTSRGMTITSVPPAAEVSVNHRVIGVTPIRVNYTHYGYYRIELRKDRYQTLVREESVSPPWYGYDPITFVADNVVPARINDEMYLHYVLTPVQEMNRDELLKRANLAREGKVTNPRTREELEVAFTDTEVVRRAPKTITPAPGQAAPLVIGPEATPRLDLPQEPKEKPPEGPRIETPPGEKKEESKPEPPKEQSKPEPKVEQPTEQPKPAETPEQPKRMRRTPTGEVLIYEEQPVEDPNKKKK